ncbi:unnamed protein product [Oikopleura dioica]|uniref:Dynactin subunit 1 n=1 Tax=Oikopleura dioica TaxID=34765 RepID=E4Y6G7_OIKDI|nr:unnamed protein product [Oikopleura dioica]
MGVEVGQRVSIPSKDVGNGTVAFVGETAFAKGVWIGIVLDEQKGKNNGTIQETTYFTCEEKYGMFVREQLVAPPSETVTAKPPSRPASRISMMADKRKSLAPKAATPKVSRDPSLDKIKPAKTATSSPPKAASPPKETVAKPPSPVKETEALQKSAPVQTLQEISDQQGIIAALRKENTELQASVKDWKDKTDILVAKRRQDREALKDAERNRIQLQSFEEFKVRIMEQNKEKLRELDAARKTREELQAEFDQFRDDMADSSETIEMLTLDKEMAEEAAEIARSEVEEIKIRLEEAETDLEILRAEAESANETVSGDGEGVTPLQLRIKDDEIQRLKDAIVKFRDLNAEEKQAAARALKQSKSDQEELALAKKLQQKFEDANKELQDELIELKEQVDLALGSEEMVENLTIRVLDLEEKLQEEKERADDLDELHELDAEMGEVAREKELELREENDMINSRLRDVTRKLEAEIAHASDLQETIKKFRHAVTIQKDEIEQYKEQSSRGEGDGQAETSYSEATAAVLTERVLERRHHSTQVELDLRKLESDLLAAHVSMLQMFLPHAFKTRGGDADGVKIELLIRRLSAKARIIQTEVMDKYDLESSTGDPAQTETDIWAAELVDILETFRGYTETFTGILQDCSIETWKRVATLYHEMVPHEAVLDYFIDLVRRDALDETISLLNLQKSLGFIAHVHGVHFAREQDDAAGFILRLSRKGLTLSNRLGVTTARLQNLVLPGQELSDPAKLLTDIIARLPSLRQTFRRIQRLSPDERHGDMDQEQRSSAREAIHQISIISEFLQYWANTTHSQAINLEQKHLPEKQLHDASIQACNKVYGPGNEGLASVKGSIQSSFQCIAKINTRLQEGDFHVNKALEAIEPAVKRRAAEISVQSPEELQLHMEDKDTVIKELKQALRIKSDETEQLQLKADMFESRSSRANMKSEEASRKLDNELKETKELLAKKEKEYEKTCETYRAELISIKDEKNSLQVSLTHSQRKNWLSQNKSNMIERLGFASPRSPTISSSSLNDSPLLTDQIMSLSRSVSFLQKKLARSEGRSISKRMSNLQPLPTIKLETPDMIDLSHKIEAAAAPLLRPAQLIKVGQPQPAMLRLAGDLAQRAKSAKVLPSLESELRNAVAQAQGGTLKTQMGQEFPTKIFNQAWDGRGALSAELLSSKPDAPMKNIFLDEEQFRTFSQLLQPAF